MTTDRTPPPEHRPRSRRHRPRPAAALPASRRAAVGAPSARLPRRAEERGRRSRLPLLRHDVPLHRRKAQGTSLRTPLKILIVAPSWIGDTIMMQPLLMRLQAQRPDAAIHVLAPAWSAPLLARMPEVAAVIENPFAHGEFDWAGRTRARPPSRQPRSRLFDAGLRPAQFLEVGAGALLRRHPAAHRLPAAKRATSCSTIAARSTRPPCRAWSIAMPRSPARSTAPTPLPRLTSTPGTAGAPRAHALGLPRRRRARRLLPRCRIRPGQALAGAALRRRWRERMLGRARRRRSGSSARPRIAKSATKSPRWPTAPRSTSAAAPTSSRPSTSSPARAWWSATTPA